MAEATLEEMALAHERGRKDLEEAKAAFAEIKPQYMAAAGRVNDLERALTVIEDGMENASRAYMIDLTIKDAGLAELVGSAPRVIPVQRYSGFDRWEITAVGSEGTPLYVYKSGQRSRIAKEYARPKRPGDDEAVAAYKAAEAERQRERRRTGRLNQNEYERVPRPIMGDASNGERVATGLVQWQERGTGAFGDGSGALKPQPPPEGGRWKWLKVRDQGELETNR